LSAPTDNQLYVVPANQFSPSAGTTLLVEPQIEVCIEELTTTISA